MRVSMRFAVVIAVVTMGMSTLSLGTADPVGAQSPKRYVVLGVGGSLPADFEALIGAAGGTVVHQMDQIGVAVVESSDPSFLYAAEGIAGVQGVAEDRTLALDDPQDPVTTVVESMDTEAIVASDPGNAKFFWAQWNLKAIRADEVWTAGLGDPSVRVAVIDTGVDYTHQELVGKIDMEASKSFFPEPLNLLPPGLPVGFVARDITDFNGHGTHVAAIIAGQGNSVAGVAPRVTLIAVKVAGRTGFAEFGTIIQAIVYAADAGADVINMSFGDQLKKAGRDENGYLYALYMAAFNRAANYAHARGALLVASAGNNAINWDRMGNTMKVPAQLPHVVAVSATGRDPLQLDLGVDALGVLPAGRSFEPYTDYGHSIITMAAPGGSVTPFVARDPNNPKVAMWADRILSACSRFTDLGPTVPFPSRFPCRGSAPGPLGVSNVQMIGTSMAAAHVSGLAALVDSAHGGSLTGEQILDILMRTAVDLGKPGRDEFYGFGLINAVGAVTGK